MSSDFSNYWQLQGCRVTGSCEEQAQQHWAAGRDNLTAGLELVSRERNLFDMEVANTRDELDKCQRELEQEKARYARLIGNYAEAVAGETEMQELGRLRVEMEQAKTEQFESERDALAASNELMRTAIKRLTEGDWTSIRCHVDGEDIEGAGVCHGSPREDCAGCRAYRFAMSALATPPSDALKGYVRRAAVSNWIEDADDGIIRP